MSTDFKHAVALQKERDDAAKDAGVWYRPMHGSADPQLCRQDTNVLLSHMIKLQLQQINLLYRLVESNKR